MDWVAAKSYYIGYSSIDRFLSIRFIHNYLLTWSIAILCSLTLPFLFLFAPGSLHTTRTIHFLLVSIVCLSYMSSLYVQAYMISNAGEPNLSYHSCRFIVYISTVAKPMGIYLTLLFSLERLITKIISRFFLSVTHYSRLCRRLYAGFIFLCLIIICSRRLYDIFKLLPRDQSMVEPQSEEIVADSRTDITDTSENSTDRNITFKYCFNSMNIDTYARILSFYVMQYWYEYLALGVIFLVFLVFIFQQYCLIRAHRQHGSLRQFSVNTKFYVCLSSCVVATESILLFLHLIVDDISYNNQPLQLRSLQIMLFAFNFRCIILPLLVCATTCDPLKQFFYDLLIIRPYLENFDENDNTETMNNRPEPFSSPQRSSNRTQLNLRRQFQNNSNNNHFDNDESQADL